jgi:CRISPR/Cas system-associated exonuclease Cas4 (RecB family)
MTPKQQKFIESLIDQIGFRNSPRRGAYLTIIFERCQSIDDASKMIEKLLTEKQLRNTATIKKQQPKHIAVTNLSSFTFCPASYVISETYNIEKTEQILEGEELNNKRFLSNFLYNLRNKRLRQIGESKLKDTDADKFLYRGTYGDLLESKVTFEGHLADSDKIFYSDNNTLAGVPDYIYERPDNRRFVVEEKHTWRREKVNKPFKNHVVQVSGYLHGIKSLNLSYGYIVYFHWGWFRGSLSSTDIEIHKVAKENSDKNLLIDIYKSVQSLKKGESMDFDIDGLNTEKCFGCSVRALCRHKNGKYTKLKFPYNKSIN